MIAMGRVRYRAAGFSLVELMVAMVLGLILIAAVLQVFVGNRQTQVLEASLARVQEAGRLALEFISEDLRQAGFYGSGDLRYSPISMMKPTAADLCTGRTEAADVLNVSNNDQYDSFVDGAIRVYSRSEAGWSPSAPTEDEIPSVVKDSVRKGTDVISIWYAVDTGAKISGSGSITGTANVPIAYTGTASPERCFGSGELAMLSNPAGSVLFRITNSVSACSGSVTLEHAASSTGNCSNSLGPIAYDSFARVMKVVHRVYYIKDTGRTNAEGKQVFSLHRYQFSNKTGKDPDNVELVEGVEFLNLTYSQRKLNGLNVDNGKVRFDVSAASVEARSIKSARIGVLVQGLDPVRSDDDDKTYTLVNGVSIAPPTGSGAVHTGGKTMRQVFNANVELRNRAQ